MRTKTAWNQKTEINLLAANLEHGTNSLSWVSFKILENTTAYWLVENWWSVTQYSENSQGVGVLLNNCIVVGGPNLPSF